MSWRSHPVFDSDLDFRTFWLQSKMDEVPEVLEATPSNPCVFLPLAKHPCSMDCVHAVLSADHPFTLDGMLFYHREGHYHAGIAPIVAWLTPDLVPVVLGLTDVHIPSAAPPEPAVRLQLGAPPAQARLPGSLKPLQARRPGQVFARVASPTVAAAPRRVAVEAPACIDFVTEMAAEVAAVSAAHHAAVLEVADEFRAYVVGLPVPPAEGELEQLLDEHDRTLGMVLLERDLALP